jgi:hypothetical protein
VKVGGFIVGAFLTTIAACAVFAVVGHGDANVLQVRDCKAALRVAAKRGPVTTRPPVCEPLSASQYAVAYSDGTRVQRIGGR